MKSLQFLKKGVKCLGLAGIVFLSGCGDKVNNTPYNYTVVERLGDKLKTVGVGYKYDFFESNEKGRLLFTIEPDYKGKLKKGFLADDYFVKDGNGKILYNVEGKILTISATSKVYNNQGEQEAIISRKFGGSLFNRVGRLILGKDGYFIKNKNEVNQLELQETWASVWSPILREYKVISPQSNQEIGMIKNKFQLKGLLGAQTYQIELDRKDLDLLKNLALVMRVVDGIEDTEDAESSSSSSSSSKGD